MASRSQPNANASPNPSLSTNANANASAGPSASASVSATGQEAPAHSPQRTPPTAYRPPGHAPSAPQDSQEPSNPYCKIHSPDRSCPCKSDPAATTTHHPDTAQRPRPDRSCPYKSDPRPLLPLQERSKSRQPGHPGPQHRHRQTYTDIPRRRQTCTRSPPDPLLPPAKTPSKPGAPT